MWSSRMSQSRKRNCPKPNRCAHHTVLGQEGHAQCSSVCNVLQTCASFLVRHRLQQSVCCEWDHPDELDFSLWAGPSCSREDWR